MLTALGLLDEEIEAVEKYGEQFDRFEEADYQAQLEKARCPDRADGEANAEEGGGSWNSQ